MKTSLACLPVLSLVLVAIAVTACSNSSSPPAGGGETAGTGWSTDPVAALARAKQEGKRVLLDFTGSDWCPPCKMLHGEVFTTAQFQAYAATNLIAVELDFPRRKAQAPEQRALNEAWSKQYGIQGFPTIILLSPDGRELWRQVGYMPGGPAGWIAKLESFPGK